MKNEGKNYKLQKNENDITLSRRDEVKIITIALTQKTQRSIDILSTNLDSGIYDNTDFIDAVKNLSIISKFTRIRILIKDSDSIIKNSHRMIPVIQQLTSSIEVRCISEEYKNHNTCFALFDKRGVVYLNHADRYDGFANFDRPRLALELTNYFDEIWEHSVPDINLRRLTI